MNPRLIGILTAAAALSACTAQQVQNVGNRALGTLASQAPRLAGEGALGAQIEARFVGIDPNSALHVALGIHSGAVTLSGKVASATTRAKYIDAARHTPGVHSVAARLRIDPSLATPRRTLDDFGLLAAVRANLAAQAGLNGLRLHVVVHGGTVSVSGTAQNAGLKAIMLQAVRKTSGVRSVVDHIGVGS